MSHFIARAQQIGPLENAIIEILKMRLSRQACAYDLDRALVERGFKCAPFVLAMAIDRLVDASRVMRVGRLGKTDMIVLLDEHLLSAPMSRPCPPPTRDVTLRRAIWGEQEDIAIPPRPAAKAPPEILKGLGQVQVRRAGDGWWTALLMVASAVVAVGGVVLFLWALGLLRLSMGGGL